MRSRLELLSNSTNFKSQALACLSPPLPAIFSISWFQNNLCGASQHDRSCHDGLLTALMWESTYVHVAKSTRPVSGTTESGRQSATSEPFNGPSPKTRTCSALETCINSSYTSSRFILLRMKDVTPPKSPFTVVILLSQETNADVAVPSFLVLSDDPYRSILYVHQSFNRRRSTYFAFVSLWPCCATKQGRQFCRPTLYS